MSPYRTPAKDAPEPDTQIVVARDQQGESPWVWVATAILAAEATLGYWVDFSPKWLVAEAGLDVILFSFFRITHLLDLGDDKAHLSASHRSDLARAFMHVIDCWPGGDSRKTAPEWIRKANPNKLTPPQAEQVYKAVQEWAKENV